MAPRTVATSASYELSGNCTAVTFNPLATSNGITFDQLEASAQAPWTRTIFDILLIGFLLGSRPPGSRALFGLCFVALRSSRFSGRRAFRCRRGCVSLGRRHVESVERGRDEGIDPDQVDELGRAS